MLQRMIRSVVALAVVGAASMGWAAENDPHMQTPQEKKGIDYLVGHQEADGAWLHEVGPAVTAMVVRGLIQAGRPLEDPAVSKGLSFIESCRQKDGGYYKDSNPNYNSCIVLSLFAAIPAPASAAYKERILGLQNFLKSLQQVEGKKDPKGVAITPAHPWYGGSGYGEDRPDMSNTSYFVEALHDSGVPASDPAMQKALVFLSRSQMLSETNDQAFAKGATDGGFIYTPAEGGESKFGDVDKLEGGSTLRSYGSMTYSGFKSLLYAGLTADDPRVKAAVKWIQANWSLDYNPGSSSFDGQYYFLHAFGKAMRAWGHDTVTDVKGVKHDWRAELVQTLVKNQREDGSWINPKSPRWFEGNPILVTAYGVLTLEEARR
jgi:squalene-hopene/tetraprenyl-beta-curcumene cyclase